MLTSFSKSRKENETSPSEEEIPDPRPCDSGQRDQLDFDSGQRDQLDFDSGQRYQLDFDGGQRDQLERQLLQFRLCGNFFKS